MDLGGAEAGSWKLEFGSGGLGSFRYTNLQIRISNYQLLPPSFQPISVHQSASVVPLSAFEVPSSSFRFSVISRSEFSVTSLRFPRSSLRFGLVYVGAFSSSGPRFRPPPTSSCQLYPPSCLRLLASVRRDRMKLAPRKFSVATPFALRSCGAPVDLAGQIQESSSSALAPSPWIHSQP